MTGLVAGASASAIGDAGGMADLQDVSRLVALDHGLAVVSTQRADGTPLATVVNAGVLDHPRTGAPVVGFVARGDSSKLTHLRARPHATLTFRAGWDWVSLDGPVQLIGPDDPDDPEDGVDAEGIRLLLRAVFHAAGGEHEDLEEFDRVMAAERRAAVLVTPARVYGNRPT
jgi:PPOX class probable F420-dependent enzyme